MSYGLVVQYMFSMQEVIYVLPIGSNLACAIFIKIFNNISCITYHNLISQLIYYN